MMTKTSLLALAIASSFAAASPALAQTNAAEVNDVPGDIVTDILTAALKRRG